MALVVDHVFLFLRLALRSGLCDGALLHIRLDMSRAACFPYVLDNTASSTSDIRLLQRTVC